MEKKRKEEEEFAPGAKREKREGRRMREKRKQVEKRETNAERKKREKGTDGRIRKNWKKEQGKKKKKDEGIKHNCKNLRVYKKILKIKGHL